MMSGKKRLIVIVGATGSGKTDLSVAIAERFSAPIISTDSRQFYRGMAIGTAQPSREQMERVEHHFVDCRDVGEEFNCGAYEREALERLAELFEKHDTVVAVGGSGLYIKALCEGMDDLPDADPALREELLGRLENEGLESLVEQLKALRLTLKKDFGIVEPRIAVLALNPHAGDGGLLGSEEAEVIRPAVVEAYESGVLAFGPLSADGLFASGAYAKYDAVLAMYHDQGLTPFKTLSPEGVNFTAGLSMVRTSPDHGVAYDIAGKGIADEQSMRNAIYAAIDIVRRRDDYEYWSRNPLEHFEREKGKDVSVKDLKLPEVPEE